MMGIAQNRLTVVGHRVIAGRWVLFGFRSLALLLAGLHTWAAATSYSMNADGISYLDIGDAYMRGDWATAVNPVWSPLYSWILGPVMALFKPSMRWEFPLVHIVNFAIYSFALICFEFFWRQLRHYQQQKTAAHYQLTFPDWAWWALGYCLFIWTSLALIEIWAVTPDMLMAALVYVAAALLIRLRLGYTHWHTFILLGTILGLGYLAKAIMFPLAFVFLGISLFSPGNHRYTLPRVLVALLAFLIVTMPYISLISQAAGELTFGQAGTITYVRYVNGVSYPHWQGEPAGNGTPLHPSRQIFAHPPVFEFGTPIGGTYPISLNPVYWYEGVVAHFDAAQQMRLLLASLLFYFDLFFHQLGILLLGVLTLYLLRQNWNFSLADIIPKWGLAIVAVAAFVLYGLVLVEGRYIAVFVVLFWANLLVKVRVAETQIGKRLLVSISITMIVFLLLNLLAFNLEGYNDLSKDNRTQTAAQTALPPSWPGEVAEALHQLGIRPGDHVGVIGYAFDSFWARLARVHIAAEMLDQDAGPFWTGSSALRAEVMATFANAGVTAVVAEYVPDGTSLPGWHRVGNSNFYIYLTQ
jgi:hypothetical protein